MVDCSHEHCNYGQTYYQDGQALTVDEFGPDFEMQHVRQFLADNTDDPFFLFYNISPPHGPIGPGNSPEEYVNLFDPAEVPLLPNVWKDGELPYDERWFKIYTIWDYFWRTKTTICGT